MLACRHQRTETLMKRRGKILIIMGLAVCAGAAGVAYSLAFPPAITAIARPGVRSFDPAQVARGATLAAIGDCTVCHTADGGIPFAGGRPLATPFGTLYVTNITPDEKTGIGAWSKAAFRRAMRDGIARNGEQLYPALPYEHFTHVTDADLDSLYAFLMTRHAVDAAAPPNQLIAPLGFRPMLAGWKMLFVHHGEIPFDPRQSAVWNRGAYLVEGLGHCGGCHTPRNVLGGEERGHAYDGGVAEGWRAPALNARNPAARHWTIAALTLYLRTGLSPDHSAAGGPMGPVVEDLASVPDDDVRAIATYIGSKMPDAPVTRPPTPETAAAASPDGATLFAGACAGCHGIGAPMAVQGRPALALSSDLRDTDPLSAVQAVLSGVAPPIGNRGPKMPGFADSLTDAQIAAVTAYARARYTDQPAWPTLQSTVRAARKEMASP
jgi:mono/diheme cytochrome c family protein